MISYFIYLAPDDNKRVNYLSKDSNLWGWKGCPTTLYLKFTQF